MRRDACGPIRRRSRIWGTPGVPVPAALGAAPVAGRRRCAHPQGARSDLARHPRLPRPVHAVAGSSRSTSTIARIRRPGRRIAGAVSPRRSGKGNTLKITTTHLKDGFLKRGGSQTSDMLTMTEYLTRHDDILTIVQVVDDPIYLDEPYVLSITYSYDPNAGPATENCSGNPVRRKRWHRSPSRPALPARAEQRDRRVHQDRELDSRSRRFAAASRRLSRVPRRLEQDGDDREPHRAGLEVGERREEGDCRPEPARRAGACPAGAGQHLHARRRRHEHHRLDWQGRHQRRQHRPGADVRQGSGGVDRPGEETVNAPVPNNCFGANCPSAFGQPAWSSPYFNAFIASPRPPQGMRFVFNTSAASEHAGGNEKLAAAANFKRAGGAGGFGECGARSRHAATDRRPPGGARSAEQQQAGRAGSAPGRPTPTSTTSTS